LFSSPANTEGENQSHPDIIVVQNKGYLVGQQAGPICASRSWLVQPVPSFAFVPFGLVGMQYPCAILVRPPSSRAYADA